MVEYDPEKSYSLKEFVVNGYPKGNYRWEGDNHLTLQEWQIWGLDRGEVKIRNELDGTGGKHNKGKKISIKITNVGTWGNWTDSKTVEILPGKSDHITAIHMGGKEIFIHEFGLKDVEPGDFPPPKDNKILQFIMKYGVYIILFIIVIIIIIVAFTKVRGGVKYDKEKIKIKSKSKSKNDQ